MSNLRDKFLSLADVKTKTITDPDWGEVFIRSIDGNERARIQSKVKEVSNSNRWAEVNALCVLVGVGTANGERVFNDNDYLTLMQRNGQVIERIADEVVAFNGLGSRAVEDAKKN